MTGWSTKSEVIELRDEILAKFRSVDKETMKHAWYWVSFDMNIVEELDEKQADSRLDDASIEWLRSRPDRFQRHKEIKQRLVELYRDRLKRAEEDLARLG